MAERDRAPAPLDRLPAATVRGSVVRLALWIALIVLIVVPWGRFVDHTTGHRVGWVPFLSPPVRVRDVVANVGLYVPFGYWLVGSRAAGGLATAALSGAVLSFGTEATQLWSHGRFPSATDLASNTIGAVAGAYVALRRRRRSHPPARGPSP